MANRYFQLSCLLFYTAIHFLKHASWGMQHVQGLRGATGLIKGMTTRSAWTQRAHPSRSFAVVTALHPGEEMRRAFVQYQVYKGKAAMALGPIRPTWRRLKDGGMAVDRQGTMLLEFAPAAGERIYDWNKKLVSRCMDFDDCPFADCLPRPHNGPARLSDCSFVVSGRQIAVVEQGYAGFLFGCAWLIDSRCLRHLLTPPFCMSSKTFAMNPTEIGTILAMMNQKVEFFHDPRKGTR